MNYFDWVALADAHNIEPFVSACFSPDGKLLAVGNVGYDNETDCVDIWCKTENNNWDGLSRTLRVECPCSLCFDKNGEDLLLGGSYYLHRLIKGKDWLENKDEKKKKYSCAAAIDSIQVSQNGTVASASKSMIKFWNLSPKFLQISSITTPGTKLIRWIDDETLVSISDDMIKFWQKNDDQWQLADTIKLNARASALDFNVETGMLVVGMENKNIKLWKLEQGKYQEMETISVGSIVSSISFGEHGRTLALGGFDGSLSYWKIENESCQLVASTKVAEGIIWVGVNSLSTHLAVLTNCTSAIINMSKLPEAFHFHSLWTQLRDKLNFNQYILLHSVIKDDAQTLDENKELFETLPDWLKELINERKISPVLLKLGAFSHD